MAGVLAFCINGLLALALSEFVGRHLSFTERRNWRVVGLFFIALAIWRLSHGEQWVLDHLRAWTRVHNYYDGRHKVQVPATIGIVAIAGFILLWLARTGYTRFSKLAALAASVLLLFSLVRLISLHEVDTLLFRSPGPLQLNPLIDAVLTGSIALLALLDVQRGRRQAGRLRSSDPGTPVAGEAEPGAAI